MAHRHSAINSLSDWRTATVSIHQVAAHTLLTELHVICLHAGFSEDKESFNDRPATDREREKTGQRRTE